jgi:pimeloyl-ACP methyl ester carboxylesterase
MSWALWSLGLLAALLGAAFAAERLADARNQARFPPPGRMIAAGGRKLHLLCKGDLGPTVVIEQGAGSPSILWGPIQDKVAAFARICTYDRAGYQWSDAGPRVRSLQDRVDDLHAVLAHVPGPYVLVAHSFGGPLIRTYAQAHPDQVAGMVLVDTPEEGVIFREAYRSYCAKMGWAAGGMELAARFGLVRFALRWMTDVPPGLSSEGFGALKAAIARPDFFRAMSDDPSALDRGPRDFGHAFGNKPLVVIRHGEKFPGPAAVLEEGWEDGQKKLAAMSTRGELVVAAKSNHMVPSDEPDVVISAIRHVVEMVRVENEDQGALPPGPPAGSRGRAPGLPSLATPATTDPAAASCNTRRRRIG